MSRFSPSDMVPSFNDVVEKIKSKTFLANITAEKRDAILSNLESIKDVLFNFRYPKIAILGDSKRSRADTLSLFLTPEILRNEMMLGEHWYAFDDVEVADFRNVEVPVFSGRFPDLFFCLLSDEIENEELEKMLLRVAGLQEEVEDERSTVVEAIFLIEEKESSRQFYKIRKRVIDAWKNLGMERSPIFSVGKQQKVSDELLRCVPAEAQLPLMRVLVDDAARTKYIDTIIGLATATNSTIASVPLPFADLIPITTVQTLMVVAIAYARGHDLDAKMIKAFLASLGINLSVGFAMREIVRALAQFIPVAGPFVSSSIAASTTMTLGKKASTYFKV